MAKRLTKLPPDVFSGFMVRALRDDVDFRQGDPRKELRNALHSRNVKLLKEPNVHHVFEMSVSLYAQVLATRTENIIQCSTCSQRFIRKGRVSGFRFRLERHFVAFSQEVICPLCTAVAVDQVAHAPRVRVRAAARVL